MATQDQKTQRDSPILKLQEILALIPPNAKQVLMAGEIPVNLITTLKNRQKCKVDKIIDHLQPENQPTEAVDYTYTVILDPPYTYRKAKEKYNGNMIGQLPKLKNELKNILNKNARVISFGWDTVGMSKSRGFEKIAICVVCHNGDHRDTLCLVEKKI